MKRRLSLLLLLLLLLAVACGPAADDADVESGQATATAPAADVDGEGMATVAPYPAPQELPTNTPLPDGYPMPPTPPPDATGGVYPGPGEEGTAEPQGPTGGLPPGLVYEADDATWVVGPGGAPNGLAPRTGLELSPDGSRSAYIEGDDIYLLDLNTDETTNLTAGRERAHTYVAWWPGLPDSLIATSHGAEDVGPNYGRLTLLSADGADYDVLGEMVSYALPAGDNAGSRIAYDEAGQPFIYDVDAGVRQPFDPAAFTLPEGITVARAASPAWSPDDSLLAWMMGIERADGPGEEEIALGIFDREAQSAQVIHPYITLGRGGWLIAPTWSPDGAWVTFPVETGDAERGMWVSAADGSSEQLLGGDTFSPVFWLPDSSAVLVSIPDQATMTLAQYSAPAWEETMLGLTHMRVLGWIEQ